MKTKIFPALVTLIATVILMSLSTESYSQRITGDRDVRSETRHAGTFDAVKVSSAIDLVLIQGEGFSVEVIADQNLLDQIQTTSNRGTLEIYLSPRVSVRNYKQMQVIVTAPSFRSIEASGASDVKGGSRIKSVDLKLKSRGASNINLDLNVTNLDIICSGASTLILQGSAENITAKAAGASDIKASTLVCHFLDAELSGASDMHVTVTTEATGRASGASSLKVRGNPRMDVLTSGASTARANP